MRITKVDTIACDSFSNIVWVQIHTDEGIVGTGETFRNPRATIEHVQLMRETVGQHAGVKASGGIRDRETALAMIEAGATRIGASSGVRIVGD